MIFQPKSQLLQIHIFNSWAREYLRARILDNYRQSTGLSPSLPPHYTLLLWNVYVQWETVSVTSELHHTSDKLLAWGDYPTLRRSCN